MFLCPKLEPSPPPTPPVIKDYMRDALQSNQPVQSRNVYNSLKTKNGFTISPNILDSSKLSPILNNALNRKVTLLTAQRDLTNYFSEISESTLSSNKNKSSSISNSNSVSNSGIKIEPRTTPNKDIATTSVSTEIKTEKAASYSITLTGVKLEANENEDQKDIKLKNALISHSDDDGTSNYQFQTEDQHNLGIVYFFFFPNLYFMEIFCLKFNFREFVLRNDVCY